MSLSVSGVLWAGTLKFGVRWNTVRCVGLRGDLRDRLDADEPVPITATRLPVKSTPSCGQAPVW